MKRIFILSLLIWSMCESYAQEKFTLSLELVNPSGKVDGKSYFLARLKNHNDSLSMFIGFGSNGFGRAIFNQSFLRIIYKLEGEPEFTSQKKPFFDFGDKKAIIIKPSSELQVKLPLFVSVNEAGSNGVLPIFLSMMHKVKRVRIKLEKFEFMPIRIGSLDPKYIFGKKTIDIYSNWIDINAAEFIPLLQRMGIKKKGLSVYRYSYIGWKSEILTGIIIPRQERKNRYVCNCINTFS